MFGIDEAISSVSSLITTGINKIWPDAGEKEKNELTKYLADLQAMLVAVKGQLDINMKEAEHSSVFVSGWRPFVGWTCGGGLAYNFLLHPILNWGWSLAQAMAYIPLTVNPPPILDLTTMSTVLMGMLGLGTMRSFEKIKGVARKN